MVLATLVSTTRVPLLVNLRSAVVAGVRHLFWAGLDPMGTVLLRFPKRKRAAMCGSGLEGAQVYELPTTGASASVFACDWYFWESRVVAEFVSLDQLEVAGLLVVGSGPVARSGLSVEWSKPSFAYLASSSLVRSRSMNQSSQFSPAQPLRARPSVVAELPLVSLFGVPGYSIAWSESLVSSFVVIPKPVKPSPQLSPVRRSVVAELLSLYQSRV